jgi:hypothetical protein
LVPEAPVIDFDAPEYLSFRSDPENFFDPYHLEPRGASQIVSDLQRLVPAALAVKD